MADQIQKQFSIANSSNTDSQPDEKRQVSSVNTIFAVTNSMVGSVCLVIPMSFAETGVVMSILIMFLIGFISNNTCSLIVKCTKDYQDDMGEVIERVLGQKWKIFFCFASGLLMFIVGIIYFLLINANLYPMLTYIFYKSDLNPSQYAPDSGGIIYDQFSVQYLCMIMIVVLYPMLYIKDFKIIVKMAHGGIGAIVAYVVFIVYIFIQNLATGGAQQNWGELQYFSSSVADVAGQFALAFMVHNAICQIIRSNIDPRNNKRDVSVGYVFAAAIYAMIGIFGSIGILGKTSVPAIAKTICDYFPNELPSFIIEFLFMGHLATTFPLFNYISRDQIFSAIYGQNQPPKWAFILFNTTFALVSFISQLVNVNPSLVIGIDGAVVGFLIVYLLPIALHFQTEYGSLLPSLDGTTNHQLLEREPEQGEVKYSPQQVQNNKIFDYFFYGVFMFIGIALVVIQLLQVFNVKLS